MRTKRTIRWAVGVVAVLALVPSTAGSTASVDGSATATNTLVRVTAGAATVAAGVEEASSVLAASRSALARFIAAEAGSTRVGKVERQGVANKDSGTDQATPGTLAIDGLASIDLLSAAADIAISSTRVASTATASLADVDLLSGLVRFDGLALSSSTEVNSIRARATRSVTLDGVNVFDVEALLAAMGVDPVMLTCAAVAAAGDALGVDTASACSELAAVVDAMSDSGSLLDAAAASLGDSVDGFTRSQVDASRDAVVSLSCGIGDVTCVTGALAAIASTAEDYGVNISDPTDLTAARQQLLDGLDALLAAFDDLALVQQAVSDAAEGTCAEVSAALDDVTTGVSSFDPAGVADSVPPAAAAVASACATLRATLDTLLDTPMVRLDDVEVTLTADANEANPQASVAVSIGSISIGMKDAVPVAAGDDLTATLASLRSTLDDVVDALGLGMAAPTLDLFAIDEDAGADAEGRAYADASLTAVRLTIPAASLDVPSDPPLNVLGSAGGASPGAGMPGGYGAPRALLGIVNAPEVVFEAGVFEVGSGFTAAADCEGDECDPCVGDDCDTCNGEDCEDAERTTRVKGNGYTRSGPLPKTGLSRGALSAIGLFLVAAAVLTRRFALVR